MPRISVAYGSGLPTIPLMVGPNGPTVGTLVSAGQPVPRPIHIGAAVIDTGATTSSADPDVIRRAGGVLSGVAGNQTAGGMIRVNLYRVSVGFAPVFGLTSTVVVADDLEISEFAQSIPCVEFLVGMDVLCRCRFTLDGPAGAFTLDF